MLPLALALRHDRPKGSFLYWGKIIGALAGAVTLKPWFVLLGLGLGHWFDVRFAAGYRQFEQQGASIGRLPEEYVRPLFQTIGHLAKSDGRVTEEEYLAGIRALIDRFDDNRDGRISTVSGDELESRLRRSRDEREGGGQANVASEEERYYRAQAARSHARVCRRCKLPLR